MNTDEPEIKLILNEFPNARLYSVYLEIEGAKKLIPLADFTNRQEAMRWLSCTVSGIIIELSNARTDVKKPDF